MDKKMQKNMNNKRNNNMNNAMNNNMNQGYRTEFAESLDFDSKAQNYNTNKTNDCNCDKKKK